MSLSKERLTEICEAIINAESEADYNVIKTRAGIYLDHPEMEVDNEDE
jgi:hypothetical protein